MQPTYIIYILISLSDRRLYIGFTGDLKNRLLQHQRGGVTTTKNRRPLQLIYFETFTNKKDAKARERFLKSGFGRKQIKKALQHTLAELNYKHL